MVSTLAVADRKAELMEQIAGGLGLYQDGRPYRQTAVEIDEFSAHAGYPF